jgi:phosphoribosylformylglycinamidine synthase II/phosphoribosylformylglycinamidine synthase I
MKVGIIRYPGSNCDQDMLNYFENAFYIWHKEDVLTHAIDLLVIPGGFAFGDRYYKNATSEYVISPGQMALESPVTSIIKKVYENKIPILGICNGFQILTKLRLLPGELKLNNDKKFTCKNVQCILSKNNEKKVLSLQVANSYGNYFIEEEKLQQLKANNQIILTYNDETYDNGSIEGIAGVCDKNHLVFGMMPHPERTKDETIKNMLHNIVQLKNSSDSQQIFHEKVTDLMNSEHISYKSTRKYLKKLYTKGEHVVQGPGENAGIIDIGDGYCLAMRIESHNHPVFIDPYQGAATGVGGIMRDIFTMGARPIAILDFLRFGNDKNSDYLLETTIKGISDYGNCFGVANVGGELYRSDMFNKNPLVNVGCLGIVKKENIIYGNAVNEGSYFIYVGSKTGSDGMNGACMASNEFSSDIDIESMKSNIQKGDPFLEKLLLEACCEITQENILEGMQDMGAGGLLCSSLELVQRGRDKTKKNLGCTLFVDNIPTKYYLEPSDRIISESQERMLLVVNPDFVQKVFDIFEKWDLEYSLVGVVNYSGKYNIIDNNENVLYEEDITNFTDILEDWPENRVENNFPIIEKVKNKSLWEQYDTTIGCRTIKGPQQSKSFAILDIYEIKKHILITWGSSVDECLKYVHCFNNKSEETINYKYEKAEPKAIVNCLNFGNPSDTMGDFSDIVNNLKTDCEYYNIPIVGGNVSLYNATDNVSIQPTPILLMVSILQ